MNAKLQALLDKEIGKKHTHGIVLGVQTADGRVNFAGAAGAADPAGAPLTGDSPYYLASITKLYTATVIMKLHEAGQLDLDAAISACLPADLLDGLHVIDGVNHAPQIKVYQLLAQTSGLADYFEDKPPDGPSYIDTLLAGQDQPITVESMAGMVRQLKPHFAPGANGDRKAHYADTNYQLLGAIIESVSSQSVPENFQQHIFDPLGLTETYHVDPATPRAPAPAAMYYKDQVIHIPQALASFAPDGGLVSTAAESIAFLRAFFGGELFDKRRFTRMMAQWNGLFFPIQYGYGMMRFKLPRLFSPFKPISELIGHSGSSGSFAFHSPATGVYLAGALNQLDAPGRPYQLMTRVINAVT